MISSILPPSQHASSSTPPPAPAQSANGDGTSSVAEIPPYERIDLDAIKQELHDALGEHGLPYWKALNGFLLGQLRRDELVTMVKKWLKGAQIQLHNRLLLGLLYNSSIPSISAQSPALSNLRKRRRLGHDDPRFDIDETVIESKARVHSWVMGLTGKERMRIRRAVLSRDDDAEDVDGDDWDLRRRRMPSFTPTTSMPPLALADRQLPSAQQLSLRLGALAKAYDLTLAPDATSELGEFLAVGIDGHLGDVIHNLVRLTGSDRRGVDTIRIPTNHTSAKTPRIDGQSDDAVHVKEESDLAKPDVNALKYLFAMIPDSHQQSSPALYKLQTSHIPSEEVKAEPSSPPSQDDDRQPIVTRNGDKQASAVAQTSPVKPLLGLPGTTKAQARQDRLASLELLKVDKGREDGDGKKDRKHVLHWRYEDPAIIFKDLLG